MKILKKRRYILRSEKKADMTLRSSSCSLMMMTMTTTIIMTKMMTKMINYDDDDCDYVEGDDGVWRL